MLGRQKTPRGIPPRKKERVLKWIWWITIWWKCLPYWEEFYSSIEVFGKELVKDTTANKANRKIKHSEGGWEDVQERKYTHSMITWLIWRTFNITVSMLNTSDYLWQKKLMCVDYSFEKPGYEKEESSGKRNTMAGKLSLLDPTTAHFWYYGLSYIANQSYVITLATLWGKQISSASFYI